MKASDFDYDLPPGRIAQHPSFRRDASRLMVLRRPAGGADPSRAGERGGSAPPCAADRPPAHGEGGEIVHAVFRDLAEHLRSGDLLVLNDTRVIPARLIGSKESGGRVEILLIEPEKGDGGAVAWEPSGGDREGARAGAPGASDEPGADVRAPGQEAHSPLAERADDLVRSGLAVREQTWLCLAGFSRAPAEGSRLDVGESLEVRYLGRGPGETHRVRLRSNGEESVGEALGRSGRVPLPPYIERPDVLRAASERASSARNMGSLGRESRGADGRSSEGDEEGLDDGRRYQTIYAERDGAIAAPTAGLHFTRPLLAALSERGVRTARITLHVGPGTFLPVRSDEIEDHLVPSERYDVPRSTVEEVARARDRGGRVIAVGTTAVRALESASDGRGGLLPARGRTDLFIVPGFRFRTVDGLITNFHLPRSSLLMLVCAFAGRERVLAAYEEAIAHGYRFYSYGDAMLIL